MNFFTQEAVVCPHCHAVYALGRFTRRELNCFGRQAQLPELAAEEKMLVRVQTLFASYPKLHTLYGQHRSNWTYRSVTPTEEWLYQLLPEAAQWNLTSEEHEVLKYISNHFVLPELFDQIRENRRKFVRKVAADSVRCRQCRRGALQFDAERLNSTYTRYLKALSDEDDSRKLMAVCLPFTLVVALLGMFGLDSKYEFLWCICTGASVLGLACICLLLYDWAAGRKYRVFMATANRKTGEGMERVFRGRYYQDNHMPHFAWKIGKGDYADSCELFSVREDGWSWLTKVLEQYEPLNRNFSAVFDLEFCGVLIGTGHFGQSGRNRFFVEIEEVLSVRLVSVNDGSGASDQLLRPAARGLETPVEQLVRPAEVQD